MPPGHEPTKSQQGTGEYLQPKENISLPTSPSPSDGMEEDRVYWTPPSERGGGVESAEHEQISDEGRVTREPKQPTSPSPSDGMEEDRVYWTPPSAESGGVENAEHEQISDGGRVTRHPKQPIPLPKPKPTKPAPRPKPRASKRKQKIRDTDDDVYAIPQVTNVSFI